MTAALADLLDSTVLVALITVPITAIATIAASTIAGNRVVRAEMERARHDLEADRDRFERERALRSEEAWRVLVGETVQSVLRFGMTARWILHVQLMGPSGPGRESLADLVDRFPDDALAALTALERVRGTLPVGGRAPAEELLEVVDRVFVRVTSGSAAAGGAETVKVELDRGLRRLLDALAEQEGIAPPPAEP